MATPPSAAGTPATVEEASKPYRVCGVCSKICCKRDCQKEFWDMHPVPRKQRTNTVDTFYVCVRWHLGRGDECAPEHTTYERRLRTLTGLNIL